MAGKPYTTMKFKSGNMTIEVPDNAVMIEGPKPTLGGVGALTPAEKRTTGLSRSTASEGRHPSLPGDDRSFWSSRLPGHDLLCA